MITLVIHQNATKYFKDEKELKVEVQAYYSLMSFLVNSFIDSIRIEVNA